MTVHFFKYDEIKTSGEYLVKREDGSCYPDMRVQRIYRFPNGYGASVVRHENSYGGRSGLYELAVLDSNDDLCYTTPRGWLTIENVEELLDEISKLPKAPQLV
jgi:hypothetical protein